MGEDAKKTIERIMRETDTLLCLDCGQCTAFCPVSYADGSFSPRKLIGNALFAGPAETYASRGIWQCLTCRRCTEVCPSIVDFSEFILRVRREAVAAGAEVEHTHAHAVRAWQSLMADVEKQEGLHDWATPNLAADPASPYIFITGGVSYYEAQFPELAHGAADSAADALKLLNLIDVRPRLLADERDSGHDALYRGDYATFEKLALHNIKLVKDSGADTVVFLNPECYYAYKILYPKYFGEDCLEGVDLMLMLELLAMRVGRLAFRKPSLKVTYQDPCRIARFAEHVFEPREILAAMGAELVEMKNYGRLAECCGTVAWQACDASSKMLQNRRLAQAADTGADVLLTSCYKCAIHFLCSQTSEDVRDKPKMPVRDFYSFVAEHVL